MTGQSNIIRSLTRAGFAAVLLALAGLLVLKRNYPAVFNESFWGHAHCIPQVGSALGIYASDHNGAFPYHTNGYGDALLMITNELGGNTRNFLALLTGPGYGTKVFEDALKNGSDVAEDKCGRIYVQGLRDDASLEIVILFDKLSTPGGDHTHGFRRFFAPLGREVLFVGANHRFVPETQWPEFSRNQVELLVKAGIPRATAKSYYHEQRLTKAGP